MSSLESPRALLVLGVALLLGSPLVAMIPELAPTDNCPPFTTVTSITTFTTTTRMPTTSELTPVLISFSTTQTTNSCLSFPNVTYPFLSVGFSVGVIGSVLAILGYVRLQRVAGRPWTTFGPLTGIALVLVLTGLFAMGFVMRGSGWVIALYGVEGLYLFALGVATGLYAIFNLYANWRSAVMLSTGIVTAGFSLFTLYATYTDFLPRCFVEVGCNPALARSTAFDLVWLGLLLTFATFIVGYGTASFRKR
jgi:cytochrome bd-type quinol oxidase subunit 1